jgi:hypothetical protein
MKLNLWNVSIMCRDRCIMAVVVVFVVQVMGFCGFDVYGCRRRRRR